MGASGGLLASSSPVSQDDWIKAHIQSLIKPLITPADNTAVATPDPHLPALEAAFTKAYQKYIANAKATFVPSLVPDPADTNTNLMGLTPNVPGLGQGGHMSMSPNPLVDSANMARDARDAAAVRRIRPSLLNP